MFGRPSFTIIRVHPQPGVLLVELEPELSGLVWANLPKAGDSGIFCMGRRDFDRLNREIGLISVDTYLTPLGEDMGRPVRELDERAMRYVLDHFAIAFNSDLDLDYVARRYESVEGVSVEGVVYAEPNDYHWFDR